MTKFQKLCILWMFISNNLAYQVKNDFLAGAGIATYIIISLIFLWYEEDYK